METIDDDYELFTIDQIDEIVEEFLIPIRRIPSINDNDIDVYSWWRKAVLKCIENNDSCKSIISFPSMIIIVKNNNSEMYYQQ